MELLELLPAEWRGYALLVLEVMVGCAGLVALVKRYFGVPDPKASRLHWLGYWAIQLLDWAAANSAPAKAKLELKRAKEQVASLERSSFRKYSVPPPPPPSAKERA